MANGTRVRRIRAVEAEVVKDTAKSQKPLKTAKKAQKPPKAAKNKAKTPRKTKFQAPNWLKAVGRFFSPVGRYLQGAWQELRVTKWPNRRSTWGLTVAVILFSVFFAVLILSFDNLFEWLLELTLNLGGN
jgi:preprotein translocase SecE subunit